MEAVRAEKRTEFLDSNCDLTSMLYSFAFVLLLILTSENVIRSTCPFFIEISCNVPMFMHILTIKVCFKYCSN